MNLHLKFRVRLAHPPYANSDERLRGLNDDVVALESEGEAQKQETEGSSMANIQRVEALNFSSRVTDALLLSIHTVGADIANCESDKQPARVDHAKFGRQLSNLAKLDWWCRGSIEY
jgi:hypothetical protein